MSSSTHNPLTYVKTGERQGSATAVQLPTISCSMVLIKAVASNAGNVYVGDSSSVTVVDGTTDVTSGLELTPGEMTPWIPINNLDQLYIICNNAGDDITYMVLA